MSDHDIPVCPKCGRQHPAEAPHRGASDLTEVGEKFAPLDGKTGKPIMFDSIEVEWAPPAGKSQAATAFGYAYEFAARWSSVTRWRLIKAAP
jgi:hypothetical protein